MRYLAPACALLVAFGCSLTPEIPEPGTSHPANPGAESAASTSPSDILEVREPVSNPEPMKMGSMEEMGDSMSESDSGGETNAAKAVYTCSMHPQVVIAEPGNCPVCGMKLKALEVEEQ